MIKLEGKEIKPPLNLVELKLNEVDERLLLSVSITLNITIYLYPLFTSILPKIINI